MSLSANARDRILRQVADAVNRLSEIYDNSVAEAMEADDYDFAEEIDITTRQLLDEMSILD